MINNKFSLLLLSILIMPMVSAFSWGSSWGYYSSPLDFLNNEWVLFTIITVIFFAIIFYTVNKTFKNSAVSSTIALGLSLLIGMTLSQRMLIYGYMGQQIGSWLLIVVSLISIGFVIKFVFSGLGSIGTMITVIGLWFIIHNVDPYQFFPYEMLTESFLNIYNFIASIFGLIIIIIVSLIALKIFKPKSLFEHFAKGMSRPAG